MNQRNYSLTTGEACIYLGVTKKTLFNYIKKELLKPDGTIQDTSNHPSNTFAIEDLEAIKPLVRKYRRWEDIPTEDEETEYGSVIHWSKKFFKPKPTKTAPKAKVIFVPITCHCGIKQDIYTYEFWRKGQPRLPLCRICANLTTRNRGTKHDRWKGGEHVNQDGYRVISKTRLTKEERVLFASMMPSRNYITEHRLVMARYLGRPLKSSEHVHHKNKDKLDNRFENLQLVSISEHADVELAWARKELKRLRAILNDHDIPY